MALAASGASAAMLLGVITVPPPAAQAATASCLPGEGLVVSAKATADCVDAKTSVIATVGDTLLGWLAPDLGFKLSD